MGSLHPQPGGSALDAAVDAIMMIDGRGTILAMNQAAERMFGYYQTFVGRARNASNPSVLRHIYPQASDPTKLQKLGVTPKQGAG